MTAILTIKSWNGYPPGSLPGNAPVWPTGHHIGNSLFTPVRNPSDPFNLIENILSKLILIHRNEPLFGSSKNDWTFTSPAMWIRMADFISFKQATFPFHVFNNSGISRKDIQPAISFHLRQKFTFFINWCINIKSVSQPGQIIVISMAWSSMDAAGAFLESYVISQDQPGFALQEGCLALRPSNLRPGKTASSW